MLNSALTAIFKPNHPYHHVYCTDRQHRFMGCNDQQAIDLGFECEAAMVGKFSPLHQRSEVAANIIIANNETVLQTGVALTCVEPEWLTDDRTILYTTHKSPLKNEKGKVIGVVGMSIVMNNAPLPSSVESLTPQQQKCFYLLLKGYCLKKIAAEMDLSYKTIEHYSAHIRKKLQCSNIRELIARYAVNIFF